MKLVNCTPHTVVLRFSGEDIPLEPSGYLPRCEMNKHLIGKIDAQHGVIPLLRSVAGEVQDLPPVTEGVGYIVSALVAMYAPKDRTDLYIVEGTERDSCGRVIAGKALAVIQ